MQNEEINILKRLIRILERRSNYLNISKKKLKDELRRTNEEVKKVEKELDYLRSLDKQFSREVCDHLNMITVQCDECEKSSGNVFKDLGFDNWEELTKKCEKHLKKIKKKKSII